MPKLPECDHVKVTPEMIEAGVGEIVREYDRDQIKAVKALFEAIKGESVSTLIRLIGEQPIESALNLYIEGRQSVPGNFKGKLV